MHSSGHMVVLCIADMFADALKVQGLTGWAQTFVELSRHCNCSLPFSGHMSH